MLQKLKTFVALLVLTALALLVHGYHPYAEDAEIYLPGVLKILNPSLYPLNADFFGEHAGHSFFPNLIAAPFDDGLRIAFLVSIVFSVGAPSRAP